MTPQPIPSAEISVVIQGPLYREADLTRRAVESAREHLPGAEIIYSGWQGAETSGLACDRIVLSEDPGGRPHLHDPRYLHNTNRQIVSTLAGLREATRRYAVKMRSDHLLTGADFLEYFDRFPKRGTGYVMFEHRVIVADIYTKSPDRSPALFHPSDWFHFGLTSDLLLLWDLPPPPEPESTEYFNRHPEENLHRFPELAQYTPEQYDWVHCLRKRYEIPFRHNYDFSAEALRIANLALANNFIILELAQIGLSAPRHPFLQGGISDCYTHGDFLRLYQRCCDPALRLSPDFVRVKRDLVILALRVRELLLKKPSGRRPAATMLCGAR